MSLQSVDVMKLGWPLGRSCRGTGENLSQYWLMHDLKNYRHLPVLIHRKITGQELTDLATISTSGTRQRSRGNGAYTGGDTAIVLCFTSDGRCMLRRVSYNYHEVTWCFGELPMRLPC